MIKKFICWLLGHKTVVKAHTGETIRATNGLDMPYTAVCYTWKKMDFCVRCGKEVHPKQP